MLHQPVPPPVTPPSTTYQRLRHYIAQRMRLSHIYQPLMLMELLGRRSPAPTQDVALRILGSRWWARFTFNGITAYGNGATSPISGSVKYRVLTRARGRCECCGAHEHQRALEVGHIIPKNQGGSDAISTCRRSASLVCGPATATAKRAVCSVHWRAAAGCCWRTSWRCASPWWRWFIRYRGDEISLLESHAIGQQRRIELQAPD
jgi:HNH endonuclease